MMNHSDNSAEDKCDSSRKRVAIVLAWVAYASLATSVAVIACVWILAWRQGDLPKPDWQRMNALYAPWAHNETLCRGIELAILLSVFSAMISMFSCVFKRTFIGGSALALSIFLFFFTLFGHLNLIAD